MVSRAAPEASALRMVAVRAQPWFLGAELCLEAGQCLGVAASPTAAEHFGDLVQGLRAPAAGSVAACGADWRDLSPHAAYALRARIRRLAPSMHWIQNLNVDENVLLPMLDSSSVPERELRTRAAAMAQRFGLDDLPRSRPHDTDPWHLWSCAAIRAFLGDPALVVVEPLPTRLPAPLRAGAVALAEAARLTGAALVWFDDGLGDGLGDGHADGDLACDGHGSLGPDVVLRFLATSEADQ